MSKVIIIVNRYPTPEDRAERNTKGMTAVGKAENPLELVELLKVAPSGKPYVEYLVNEKPVNQETAFGFLGSGWDEIHECYIWKGKRIF